MLKSKSENIVNAVRAELEAHRQNSLRVHAADDGNLSIDDFVESGAVDATQAAALRALTASLIDGPRPRDRAIFINATSTGGGVAEMRFDTVAMFRSLGFVPKTRGGQDCAPDVQWLVIDGCPSFFSVTAHMHEAMQNAHQESLPPGATETLQTVWIHNFERLEQDDYITDKNAGRTLLWIDDPQPAGLVPLVRALYPEILVVWRCHVDTTDPQEETIRLVLDTVEGRISGNPKLALLERYLEDDRGVSLGAQPLAAHRSVFHRQQFVDGARADTTATKAVLMPPAVNPLALKNCAVSTRWVGETLRHYGILPPDASGETVGDAANWPPIVCEISRFDPYKGPLELVVAFVLALKTIADDDPASTVPARARLVFAGNIPGDNLRGLKLFEHCVAFAERTVGAGSRPMFAGPLADLHERIHLLKLACANAAEVVAGVLLPRVADASKRQTVRVLLQRMGDGELESDAQSALLEDAPAMCDYVISETSLSDGDVAGGIAAARAAALDAAEDVLVLTPPQQAVLAELWPTLFYGGATDVPAARLRTGKVMNHLEVNALVTASSVRVQFSSREGFGLVVTEAMIKQPAQPFGVTIATLVGGICDQVTEDGSANATESAVALPTPYPPEEIGSSLGEYQALPEGESETLSDKQSQELFDRIAARSTVRAFAGQIARALRMQPSDRETFARAAFVRAQTLFSTPANVRQILEIFADAAAEQVN